MYRIFISVIIFYFTSVSNVNTQNHLQLNSENLSIINYIDQSKYISFPDNNECSRYCIKNPLDQGVKNAVIIWNIRQDTLSVLNDESIKSSDNAENINKPTKCVFYINIGCKKSRIIDEIINNSFIDYSKSEQSTKDNNEKIFRVDDETKMLEVTIAGKKNFSSLLLEIPLESDDKKNNSVFELSFIRNAVTKKLHVIMINPSSGKWRLKLSEIGTTTSINSIDDNKIIIAMKKSTIPITTETIKLMDSPEQLHSRNSDNIEINFNEDENTHDVNRNRTKILNKFARIVSTNNNNNDKILINKRNDVLNDLTTNNLANRVKTLTVDLAPETMLIVSPDTDRPIIFTIKNYLPLTVLCTFRAFSSQIPIVQVVPFQRWIRPGEIIKVAIYIRVPSSNENFVNTLTLHVEHESNFNGVTKSAYIYVQNSITTISDYTKPKINYSFNNNCAGKLSPEHCDDSEWTTDITVIDNESGVKNVISQPNGIQSKMNFIAGMKGSVNLLYRSTCCYTTVQITAIDVAGNSHTQEIDVTAWDNLLVGDIAAIVIGTLFLLFIIILFILMCIYCAKKRKSKDITFTQRYGSRSNPQAERTNF